MNTAGLGSLDPNVLPLDAFNLTGAEGDTQRLISLKDLWYFDGERVSYPQSGYVAGRGWWQKHADGTLVQWQTVNVTLTSSRLNSDYGTTSGTVYYYDGTWTYPIPFYAIHAQYASESQSGAVSIGWGGTWNSLTAVNWTAREVVSTQVYVRFFAIGRWKA